eukprot:SAG11_NODE_28754_length_318_cov_0.853881_1_plen_46_part_10
MLLISLKLNLHQYVGTTQGTICRATVRSDAPGEVWAEAHFDGLYMY